jgi:hypothetical protein
LSPGTSRPNHRSVAESRVLVPGFFPNMRPPKAAVTTRLPRSARSATIAAHSTP